MIRELANQSCFKEFKYLKWQMMYLQCMLIINRRLLFVGLDANIVRILGVKVFFKSDFSLFFYLNVLLT